MSGSRREFIKSCMGAAGLFALPAAGVVLASHRLGWPSQHVSPGPFEPSYVALEQDGRLARIEREIWELHNNRACCPRRCDKNRKKEEPRLCGSPDEKPRVNSAGAHFGEERPLVGRGGSGTIFFSNCSLLCCYCQNWEIAHRGDGEIISHDALAANMLRLQDHGCHNINLVTPTHLVAHILTALRIATRRGLRLPIVYNTGGYDLLEVIQRLDGVVDIYLPDFKYQDSAMAKLYSLEAENYPEMAAAAIKEMHRQVGSVVTDENGVVRRGLMVRHLVLPNNVSGTDRFLRWVAEELSPGTYVNLMAQYRPEYRAKDEPLLSRRLTGKEWAQALEWAERAGLSNLDT